MLALIHRPRKNDWTLPKGKLERGEGWKTAARRETEEETGCRARVLELAGCTFRTCRRGPKIVLYWHMALVRDGKPVPGGEVDEVAWLLPVEAVRCLDDQSQRRLVQRTCLARLGAGGHDGGPLPRAANVRAQILEQVLTLPAQGKASVLEPVIDMLGRADEALTRGDIRRARQLVVAAQVPQGC